MISTVKDLDGKVVAYVEWTLVSKSGFPMANGEYLWVNELWVHKSMDGMKTICDLVREILGVCPTTKYCYFRRRKFHDWKISKIYKRSQFESLIKENKNGRTFSPFTSSCAA